MIWTGFIFSNFHGFYTGTFITNLGESDAFPSSNLGTKISNYKYGSILNIKILHEYWVCSCFPLFPRYYPVL